MLKNAANSIQYFCMLIDLANITWTKVTSGSLCLHVTWILHLCVFSVVPLAMIMDNKGDISTLRLVGVIKQPTKLLYSGSYLFNYSFSHHFYFVVAAAVAVVVVFLLLKFSPSWWCFIPRVELLKDASTVSSCTVLVWEVGRNNVGFSAVPHITPFWAVVSHLNTTQIVKCLGLPICFVHKFQKLILLQVFRILFPKYCPLIFQNVYANAP